MGEIELRRGEQKPIPSKLCTRVSSAACLMNTRCFTSSTVLDPPKPNAGDAGGAVLASGVAEMDNCTFDGNQASSGSAVSNTVAATLDYADFMNNTLLCAEESLFLDWQDVVSNLGSNVS